MEQKFNIGDIVVLKWNKCSGKIVGLNKTVMGIEYFFLMDNGAVSYPYPEDAFDKVA